MNEKNKEDLIDIEDLIDCQDIIFDDEEDDYKNRNSIDDEWDIALADIAELLGSNDKK